MPQSKDNMDDNSTFWGIFAGAGAGILLFVIPVVIGTAKNAEAERQRIAAEISSAEAAQRQIDREEELRRNPPKPREMPKQEPIDTSRVGYSTRSTSRNTQTGYTPSERPRKEAAKYCQYPGCIEPPSGFWDKGTGYCSRHAQQLRDEYKLLDKARTQGL